MMIDPHAEKCPKCGIKWKDGQYSKLLGIELERDHPNHYDGVSYWQCPGCKTTWNRFTGKQEAIIT